MCARVCVCPGHSGAMREASRWCSVKEAYVVANGVGVAPLTITASRKNAKVIAPEMTFAVVAMVEKLVVHL